MKKEDSLKNKEIWKDIPEYENLYQISNLGNVKSLDKTIKDTKGRKYQKKGIILKQRYDKYGYKYVKLTKKGKQKYMLVHRIVAKVFINNPENLPQINHKDENRTNNNVNNLEWCDCIYNNNYGNRNKKIQDRISKSIIQLDKNNNFIKKWKNSIEASKSLNINGGNIRSCCRNELKTAGGFIWRYY